MKKVLLSFIGALCIFKVNAAKEQQGEVGVFESTSCPTEIKDSDKNGKLTCGFLSVPMSHFDDTGETFRLFVVIAKSFSKNPLPDPLILLAGGPGQSTSEFAGSGIFDGIRKKRDLIFMDQRGTGRSLPRSNCEVAVDTLLVPVLNQLAEKELQTCFSENRYFKFLNTIENANDFMMLRKALKIKQWNIYGASYGTRLGFELMRLDKQGIRSAVLESILPTNQNMFSVERFKDVKRVFEKLFEACENDAACHKAYPNLREEFFSLEEPLNKTFHTFRIIPERLRGQVEKKGGFNTFLEALQKDLSSVVLRAIGTDEFRQEVSTLQGIMYQGRISTIPGYIHAMYLHYVQGEDLEEKHRDRLFGEQGGQSSSHPLDNMSYEMKWSVLCREDYPRANFDFLTRFSEKIEPFGIANKLLLEVIKKTCPIWDVGIAPSTFFEPVLSSVPTLIFSGGFDTLTPPIWAKESANFLSNSKLLYFSNAGHGIVHSSNCAYSLFIDFVNNPKASLDIQCLDQLKGPEFVVPKAD